MSRGHGRVQRAVLLELSSRPATAYALARAVYRLDATQTPSEAQLVAVRRAIRRLRQEGLIQPPPRTPPGTSTRDQTRARRNRRAVRLQDYRLQVELAKLIREHQGQERS